MEVLLKELNQNIKWLEKKQKRSSLDGFKIKKLKNYLVQALEKALFSLILTIPIALILIELAYKERGYWAIGGEWLITLVIFIWRCKR